MTAPLNPGVALDALYSTAHWLLNQHRNRDAAHVFRTMLTCAPLDERGWLGLGRCHEEEGQDDVALRIYRSARLATPQSSRCNVALARVLARLGQPDLATQIYEIATMIAFDRDDAEIAELAEKERRAL